MLEIKSRSRAKLHRLVWCLFPFEFLDRGKDIGDFRDIIAHLSETDFLGCFRCFFWFFLQANRGDIAAFEELLLELLVH